MPDLPSGSTSSWLVSESAAHSTEDQRMEGAMPSSDESGAPFQQYVKGREACPLASPCENVRACTCGYTASPPDESVDAVALHVDLFRVSPFSGRPIKFIKRLALDDPLLIDSEGNTTQLQEGHATYYEVNEPHTDGQCQVPGGDR